MPAGTSRAAPIPDWRPPRLGHLESPKREELVEVQIRRRVAKATPHGSVAQPHPFVHEHQRPGARRGVGGGGTHPSCGDASQLPPTGFVNLGPPGYVTPGGVIGRHRSGGATEAPRDRKTGQARDLGPPAVRRAVDCRTTPVRAAVSAITAPRVGPTPPNAQAASSPWIARVS